MKPEPGWRAKTMRAMPALDDGGCGHPGVLEYLRSGTDWWHRGEWVVDHCTGKREVGG